MSFSTRGIIAGQIESPESSTTGGIIGIAQLIGTAVDFAVFCAAIPSDFANFVFPMDKIYWMHADICSGEGLGKYDAVVMIETIEHIENWQLALERVYDRLEYNGILIISTPNANGTFIKNPLHGDEWTAQQFYDRLRVHFNEVKLYDFSLENEQDLESRQTPLVAVCRKV